MKITIILIMKIKKYFENNDNLEMKLIIKYK